jgi:hypothetical protein
MEGRPEVRCEQPSLMRTSESTSVESVRKGQKDRFWARWLVYVVALAMVVWLGFDRSRFGPRSGNVPIVIGVFTLISCRIPWGMLMRDLWEWRTRLSQTAIPWLLTVVTVFLLPAESTCREWRFRIQQSQIRATFAQVEASCDDPLSPLPVFEGRAVLKFACELGRTEFVMGSKNEWGMTEEWGFVSGGDPKRLQGNSALYEFKKFGDLWSFRPTE